MTATAFSVSNLIDAVRASALNPERKREVIRDLKRLCRMLRPLDGDPTRVPALPRQLRRLLAKLTQADFQCGRRRYRNILSNIRVAMELAPDGKLMRRVAHHQLPDAWQAVMPGIQPKKKGTKPAHPLYWQAVRVKPLIVWAVEAALRPTQIVPEHAAPFAAAVIERTVAKKPERVARDALVAWNALRVALPQWPQVEMPVEKKAPFWLAMIEFTPAFQAEVREYERYCRDPQSFVHLQRIRAPRKGRYSQASIDSQLRTLRQCASLLVREGGIAVSEIKSIRDLVSRERFRLIVDVLQQRHAARVRRAIEEGGYEWEDERTRGDLTVARTLRTIGCNWCGPSEALRFHWNDQVRRLEAAEVEIAGETLRMVVRKMGLSKRYKRRLEAFADRTKLIELLQLPHKLFQEVERERAKSDVVTRQMARVALAAVALLILWRMPLRFGNLRRINLERHIRRNRKRDQTTIEMKSVKVDDLDLTVTLKGAYHKGFWLFVHHYRAALLDGTQSPWLFPSAEDPIKPIPHSTLSRLLFDKEHGIVMNRIQVRMNPHFWRHLMGWIIVAKDRAKLPLVSAVLGHKRLDTARRAYLEDDTKDAHNIIDSAMSEAIADAVAGSSLAQVLEEARF